MSEGRIDLDAEAIFHDGRWIKKDELAAEIRRRLDAGDFSVATLSGALEKLHRVMAGARTLAFRVDAEIADALTAKAQRGGLTVGELLRRAIDATLDAPVAPAVAAPAPVAGPAEEPLTLKPKAQPGAAKVVVDDTLAERSFFQQSK